jgi:hypothetical protein
MSLPFGAGIGRYAEDMGRYVEYAQRWQDVASADLRKRDLSERRDKILFGDGDLLFDNAAVVYDVNDVDKQLAVLALAMATGTRFEFDDGKYANGWISYYMKSMLESFEMDLREFLTPLEILNLDGLRLL